MYYNGTTYGQYCTRLGRTVVSVPGLRAKSRVGVYCTHLFVRECDTEGERGVRLRECGVNGDGASDSRGRDAVNFHAFALCGSDGIDDSDARRTGLNAYGPKYTRDHFARHGNGERGSDWSTTLCPTAARVHGGDV